MKKFSSCLVFFICSVFLELFLPDAAPLRAQQLDPPPTYTLQLKTIPDKPTAETELQKIRKSGYDAYLAEYTTQTGRVIYKLRIGKFKTRAAAVAAADEYAAQEGGSVMIVAENIKDAEASRPSAEPTAADEADAAKGKSVRVTVKNADTTPHSSSLQEKVAALRRGEIPAQKQVKPEDEIWYTIQVSTEPDKRSAERKINKLRDKGFDAYCAEITQNGRQLFKIRFGKYTSSEEARRNAENYTSRERRTCLVVKIASGMDVYPSGDSAAPTEKQEQAADTDVRELKQPKAVAKTVAPAAAARKQASQEPEEPAAKPEERQSAPAQRSVAAAAVLEEQAPAAEMPSEPEPQAPKKAKSHGEREAAPPDETDSAQVQPPREEAPIADAPERMTKIYAYREKSGALNLTNRYEDVPVALRQNIDYISLFPMRIRKIAKNGLRLTLEDKDERKEVILAGLTFSGQSESARAYLEALKNKPLRLKYNPWLTTKDGAIAGRLYLKEGFYINLDMMRKGLGQYDKTTLAPDQQEAFRQALNGSKR